MPTETVIILSIIVSAFAVFGAALAWADQQTSQLIRDAKRRSVNVAGAPSSFKVIGGLSDVAVADEFTTGSSDEVNRSQSGGLQLPEAVALF